MLANSAFNQNQIYLIAIVKIIARRNGIIKEGP